jgi:hypothetical protein
LPSHFTIQPQRRAPRGGWTSCAEHQATRFAVVETKVSGSGKHKRRRDKTIVAYPAKAEAVQVLTSLCRKGNKGLSPASPGTRYGPLGVRGGGTIIAASLRKES